MGNYDDGMVGATIPTREAYFLAEDMRLAAKRGNFSPVERIDIENLAAELELAADQSPDGVSYVEMGENRTLGQLRGDVRHERIHQGQSKVAGGDARTLLSPEAVNALSQHPDFEAARQHLLGRKYNNTPVEHAVEIPAYLGAGQWDMLGLDRDQGRSLLAHYIRLLVHGYGVEGAKTIFRRSHAIAQEAIKKRAR